MEKSQHLKALKNQLKIQLKINKKALKL